MILRHKMYHFLLLLRNPEFICFSQFFNEQETLLVLYSLPCFCRVICQVTLLNWECNTTLFKILETYFIKANIQSLLEEWEGNCFNCIKVAVMLISTSFLILALPEHFASQRKLINPVNKHNNSFLVESSRQNSATHCPLAQCLQPFVRRRAFTFAWYNIFLY